MSTPPVANLATPRAVQHLLRAYGLQASRRLGQNFLIDGNLAQRIVDAAQLEGDECVLEIGPGLGALTQRLVERAAQVVAIELDRGLVAILQDVLGERPNLRIIHADARTVPLGQLFPPGCRRKAVANLPYYVTTPLLFRLLEAQPPFSLMVLMVQREVAERMTARPGGKEYGALSVNVQYLCRVEWIALVPPSVFYPRPEVESAVVRLTPYPGPLPQPPAHVARVVKAAFSQRRKTLRNALRSGFPAAAVESALEAAALGGERRAETLTVEEFVRLAAALPREEDPPPG